MELVTVIVLLGILALVTVGPTLSYIASMRSRTAAARIVTDIRYMQRLALASGLRTWIVFNVAGNSYQLYMEDRNNLGKASRIAATSPMDQTTTGMTFGSSPFYGVSISSATIGTGAEVEFDNWGTPYDTAGAAISSTATISLSNGVSVSIQPVSGSVGRSG